MRRRRREGVSVENIAQLKPFDDSGFRYTSREFPPYRHIPGVTPHPRRHPQGHEFGRVESPAERFEASQWRSSHDYLYGVDLYNFAYFWEAHEAWEAAWKSTARHDLPGQFLRGLIQIAAALLKRAQGAMPGMQSLSRQGLACLRRVEAVETVFCGVDLRDYLGRMERVFAAGDLQEWAMDPRICLVQ